MRGHYTHLTSGVKMGSFWVERSQLRWLQKRIRAMYALPNKNIYKMYIWSKIRIECLAGHRHKYDHPLLLKMCILAPFRKAGRRGKHLRGRSCDPVRVVFFGCNISLKRSVEKSPGGMSYVSLARPKKFVSRPHDTNKNAFTTFPPTKSRGASPSWDAAACG